MINSAQDQSNLPYNTPLLQSRIHKIYDHLYANSNVRTPNGIGNEVGKVLHAGIWLEQVQSQIPAFNFTKTELSGLLQGHRSIMTKVSKEMRDNFNNMNRDWRLYEPGAKIIINDFDLCFTCAQLSGIILSDTKQDILGEAVEVFRSEWAKRIGGQFFTDPRVTSLAMVLLDFDPRNGDDLVDICAGTGGFLLAGLNHIKKLLKEKQLRMFLESELVSYGCSSLLGQEIDPEVCEAANSTLKARLGTCGGSLVSHGDSLSPRAFKDPDSKLRFESHLCAASNPPFGTKITVKDPEILRHYDLSKMKRSNSGSRIVPSPQPPDVLFLERNVRMLKPGKGRLAIVLPYQLLSGPSTLFVRQWLLCNTKIKAVIDLPPETFQPYTGTKTALLVVERLRQPKDDPRSGDDYGIFMSIPRWIGHDRRGSPVYKRNVEGRITNDILTDFDEIETAFKIYSQGEDPRKAHHLSFRARFKSISRDPLLHINALYHRPPAEATQKLNNGIRTSTWERAKLRDLVNRIFYPGRFKRNYVDYFPGAVPFLGGSNITEFIARTDKWLRPDDPNLESLLIHAGWILVTRSGTTGIVSIVPKAWEGYAMSEHVIRIVPNVEKIAPEYLFAFLRSKYGKEQLARGVFGSVIDEITPEYLGDILVHVPASKEKLEPVIQLIRRGEDSRQTGIENISEAIGKLDDMFSD